MSCLSHQTGGSSELGQQELVRNGLAEVKQSSAALARVEGWLIVVSVRDPSVPRSQTLVSVGDPGVLLCAPLARPAPRRNPDPRGGPGVWTPQRGKEGTRRSHALGKFPRAQPVRRFPRVGPSQRTPRAGALGGSAPHAPGHRPRVQGGPRRAHAPKARARSGTRGAAGARGCWGEARPLPPLSGSGRGPRGRSPEVPAWRPGRQSS